ncbi:MAG: ROK family transcriptional regulator [Oscillospiraceae bacterium]|nr:ROK family transcriptional regulator [Oscillospiraceae bacterium]
MLDSGKSPENIAQHNKRLILDALRKNGDMSRADLSRHLHMSFPAISSNAKGLLEADYILEVGAGDNSIGRKSTMLAFNSKRGFIIGVDWGRFHIRMMLADLLGNEIISTEAVNDSDSANVGQERITLIHDRIAEILEKSGKTKDDILCIVIGIPGIIYDGVSSLAPFTEKFSGKEFIDVLQESFEADVILENCVNLGAIGEQWKGAGVNYKDITYIAYGVGIGSAHILNGNLYKGATGAAGEIGFMLTDPVNISNKYDDTGSLELMLSISKINHYLKSGSFNEDIIKLIQNYKDGEDLYAKLMIDEIALNFGIMLANVVSVLNPEIIIIAGGLGYNFGKLFIDHWQGVVKNHFPYAPKLVLSELNHTETMLGAVMTGINHVHEYVIG